jgi:hypothetical protein
VKLTPAAARILAEVQAVGVRTYTERARPQIEALQRAGLVEVEWNVRPDALRGRHTLVATVKPVKGQPT